MYNITTDYPIIKGEPDLQISSMQNTLCNLIDELKFIFPQLDSQISSLTGSIVPPSDDTTDSG